MRRYFILLISMLGFSCIQAQDEIAKQLSDVLISHDLKKGDKLLKKISDKDIANMPDSVLLDFHYLAGNIAHENKETEKAIEHLLKVKDLCENKIGIYNNINKYLEILETLGDFYRELDKDEDALLFYEEGIVKASAFWQTKDEKVQRSLRDIRDCVADILEKQGHQEMAISIRSDVYLGYEGSFDNACDLLNQSMQYYFNDNGDFGLTLLNKAKRIFEKCGTGGKMMLRPLYRQYLKCYSALGYENKIDSLLQSKGRQLFYYEQNSYLSQDIAEIVGRFVIKHHDIETANKYFLYFVQEYDKTNPDDVAYLEKMENFLDFFKTAYSKIDSLNRVRDAHITHNYEWGLTSLQLANQLIKSQRKIEGNSICEEIYPMSSNLESDPKALHYLVLRNLADYNISCKNDSKAEQYLGEQLSWIEKHDTVAYKVDKGWCYIKLGATYMNRGMYEKCNTMLEKGEAILVPIYTKNSSQYATLLHNKGRLAQLQGRLDEAKTLLSEAKRLQIAINGKSSDKTEKYLEEIETAIKTQL